MKEGANQRASDQRLGWERVAERPRFTLRTTIDRVLGRVEPIHLSEHPPAPLRPSERGVPPGFQEVPGLSPQTAKMRSLLEELIDEGRAMFTGGQETFEKESALWATAKTQEIAALQRQIRRRLDEGEGPEQLAPLELRLHRLLSAGADDAYQQPFAGRTERILAAHSSTSGVFYIQDETALVAVSLRRPDSTSSQIASPLILALWEGEQGGPQAAVGLLPASPVDLVDESRVRNWYFYADPLSSMEDREEEAGVQMRLREMGSSVGGWFTEITLGGASATGLSFQEEGARASLPIALSSQLLRATLSRAVRERRATLHPTVLQELVLQR